VASLVDTNILVYCADKRSLEKQRIARELLRRGLSLDDLVLPHQALIEFVSVVTRPRRDLGGVPLLSLDAAHREVEELMWQFPVLYPGEEVLTTAMRGAAAYGLAWYDAHLWAYAEVHGIPEILSEDFEHGRHYGSVRVVDPFLSAAGSIHELPPLYEEGDSPP
jgi:predicted nucleic acid-binding protein